MPIYEYECKACGHRLEKLQKISAAPLVDCPACEAAELNRLVSAAGFRLAGEGWYETDFKSGNKRNLAGDAASESSSAPDKTPADKSDDSAAGKTGDIGKEKGKDKSKDTGKETTKAKAKSGGAAA